MRARYDWETIRAEYEAGGISMGTLAAKYKVSKPTISIRARKEGWLRDSSGAVNRRAEAKANGLANTVSPKKKAEALERAADAQAAVITEQRESWKGFDGKVTSALEANDFDRLKCLKIASEAMRNAQECQRKAWGIKEAPQEERRVTDVSVVVDLSHADSEQIAALVDAAYGETHEPATR